MTWSYCGPTGEADRIALRSSGVIGPTREDGGRIMVRLTTEGTPPSSSTDTKASPMPSWVMTSAVEKAGLARKVSAATFTAFWSRGV